MRIRTVINGLLLQEVNFLFAVDDVATIETSIGNIEIDEREEEE